MTVKSNYYYSDAASKNYKNSQSILDELWFDRIVNRLTKVVGIGRVLDVGCGNGQLLKAFKKRGWECYGLDVSPWAKVYSKKYGYRLFTTEVEESNIPENTFDLAVSTSTLEHIYYPLQYIKSILRVLKPGGFLYVAGIPNYNCISVKLDLSKFHYNKPPSHVNYFTPRSFYNMLKRIGVGNKVKYLKIKTYGIPESFYLYDLIRKKWINKNKKPDQKNNSLQTKLVYESLQSNKISELKIFLSKLLVAGNYLIGNPFYYGDKIEAFVIKG
ncbi:MAG: class I SAM-dependent methyltransferase [Candidatus Marinimicrobia bacterium]|nr:class I SAM-dependent methyltransferase [Candidatus Neomarinimicrobiota bacterium]